MPGISAPLRVADVVVEWRIDWLTLAITVLVGVGYLRTRLAGRRQGVTWPLHRDVVVALGLFAAVWTSSGVMQARSGQLMWVWTSQELLLFLVVPMVVVAGQPISLIRQVRGPNAPVLRVLGSRPVRVLGSPLLGPLLVPVIAALLFFSGVGALALESTPDGWVLHALLLAVGALIAIPLLDRDDTRASLAVGLALAVGLVELMLDAFPGIVLTFQHHLTLARFDFDRPSWAGTAMQDQHLAGGILWAVAEVLDVPFLVLATVRWLHADAREAQRVDAVLDALETPSVSVASADSPDAHGDPAAVRSRPWWEDDPDFSGRLRR